MMLIQNKKIASMFPLRPEAGQFYVTEAEWQDIIRLKLASKYNIIKRNTDEPKVSTTTEVISFVRKKEQELSNKPETVKFEKPKTNKKQTNDQKNGSKRFTDLHFNETV